MIWLNGKLVELEAASIDPRDRGFTLGDGLYETIRVKDGYPLHLDWHLVRLDEGLKLLAFQEQPDKGLLEDAIQATLSANGLTNAAARLTVTRGVAARGMAPDPKGRPTVAISASAYMKPASARIMIATVTRRNEHSPTARVKTIGCLDSILARIEAGRHGMDDAVLLNSRGYVAEATAANIFAVIDGVLVTPPVSDGALPGIMRRAVMTRFATEERRLLPDDLIGATEIFLTSSLGIRTVTAFSGHLLESDVLSARLMAEMQPA